MTTSSVRLNNTPILTIKIAGSLTSNHWMSRLRDSGVTEWPWVDESLKQEAERIIDMGPSGAAEAELFFMEAVRACDTELMRCALDVIEATGAQSKTLQRLIDLEPTDNIRKSFTSFWVVSGWIFREKVADDSALCDALRNFLPPYDGPPMKLYRGEIATRHELEEYGVAWTCEIEKARDYAGGLHMLQPSGGVLIESLVPAEAIISDLRELSHLSEEYEIVVDPRGLNEIREIRRFPFTER